ncbi:MAG: hypothetical protein NT025_04585 [bacterium]|nr:hypothetical protein [bacterium]
MTTDRAVRRLLLILAFFAWMAPAEAGLRDIHPRPQQMGLIGPEAVWFSGTPFLVIPDNPTEQEALVRDAAIWLFEQRAGYTLPVIEWSAYAGEQPAIWLGTFARFPQLATALRSTGLPGLGSVSHTEEYHLVVEDNRVLLGGNNELSLRWGLMSLLQLTTEMMGRLYIDRAYIRDWPDFPKRVGTVNSHVRIPEQVAWGNMMTDLSYSARMNEIEWNTSDAGLWSSGTYGLTQAVLMASRVRSYGLPLTMSVDQTAYSVSQLYWQEGIPIIGTMMRVTDTAFVPVAQGYGVDFSNGGFESWSGSRPVNWSMTRDSRFTYVNRDGVTKHSGSNSIRFSGFGSDTYADMFLLQERDIGPNKWLRIRFWYKAEDYCGQLMIGMQGATAPNNTYDVRYAALSCPATQGWTQIQFDFCTYNAGRILFLVGPKYPTGGTIWLDDLSLETAAPVNIVRREDTPLVVRSARNGALMAEGLDFRVVETYSTSYPQYVVQPRLELVPGSRLAIGDTVLLDWSCAPLYQGVRKTQCFSQIEPLLDYQERIRHVDSLLHPDGFKISINEVSYAGYDAACTRRHMTPAQLVGSYCRQMYQVIQARRPGAPVRIYGDAFDIYVRDPRAMPVTTSPWTVGALEELPAPMEIMCMEGYSSNLDSSLNYFAANQHGAVMAVALWVSTSRFVSAVRAAQSHSNCRGTQFYMWQGDCDADLPWKIPLFGDLSWNMGPYIIHDPAQPPNMNDSLRIVAEMWSDTFRSSTPPSILSADARYRTLPGGSWATVPMTQIGTGRYATTLAPAGAEVTAIEYYLTAMDHRGQVRSAPADAPLTTFVVNVAGASQGGTTGGDPVDRRLSMISDCWMLEWKSERDVEWYEVHQSFPPDLSSPSLTLIARQSPACPRLLLPAETCLGLDPDSVRVVAVRRERKLADRSVYPK